MSNELAELGKSRFFLYRCIDLSVVPFFLILAFFATEFQNESASFKNANLAATGLKLLLIFFIQWMAILVTSGLIGSQLCLSYGHA